MDVFLIDFSFISQDFPSKSMSSTLPKFQTLVKFYAKAKYLSSWS